jgi:hypothetical protein
MCEVCGKTTVVLAKGQISSAGQEAIKALLYAPNGPFTWKIQIPDDWQWCAKVGGKGEYVGSFAKRLAKLAHHNDVKLDSDFLGMIGSLVAQYSASQVEYTYDIVSRFDWADGDYGDSGSCYWGCRSGARLMLAENGARAIRLYDDDNGRGYARAWLAPYDNGYVVFNGYGEETSTFAQIFATIQSQPYKRVTLRNNGRESGELWINGGTGYYVGPNEVVYSSCIDLHWDEEHDDQNRCHHCGDYSEDCCRIDDAYYCSDCACELFSSCSRCDEWFGPDDVVECDGDWYCEDCAGQKGFVKCDDCGTWHDDCTDIDGDDVCSDCIVNGNYSRCEDCGDWHKDMTVVDGYPYCEDCVDSLDVCSKCGERHKEFTEIDGQNVCNDCLASYDYSAEFGLYVPKGQLLLA